MEAECGFENEEIKKANMPQGRRSEGLGRERPMGSGMGRWLVLPGWETVGKIVKWAVFAFCSVSCLLSHFSCSF